MKEPYAYFIKMSALRDYHIGGVTFKRQVVEYGTPPEFPNFQYIIEKGEQPQQQQQAFAVQTPSPFIANAETIIDQPNDDNQMTEDDDNQMTEDDNQMTEDDTADEKRVELVNKNGDNLREQNFFTTAVDLAVDALFSGIIYYTPQIASLISRCINRGYGPNPEEYNDIYYSIIFQLPTFLTVEAAYELTDLLVNTITEGLMETKKGPFYHLRLQTDFTKAGNEHTNYDYERFNDSNSTGTSKNVNISTGTGEQKRPSPESKLPKPKTLQIPSQKDKRKAKRKAAHKAAFEAYMKDPFV